MSHHFMFWRTSPHLNDLVATQKHWQLLVALDLSEVGKRVGNLYWLEIKIILWRSSLLLISASENDGFSLLFQLELYKLGYFTIKWKSKFNQRWKADFFCGSFIVGHCVHKAAFILSSNISLWRNSKKKHSIQSGKLVNNSGTFSCRDSHT